MHFNLLLTYILDQKNELFHSNSSEDIQNVIRAIGSKTSIQNNLTKKFVEHIRTEFEPKIDGLNQSFFDLSAADRQKHLANTFTRSKL